jgi:soluble lytic murein transglycosylase
MILDLSFLIRTAHLFLLRFSSLLVVRLSSQAASRGAHPTSLGRVFRFAIGALLSHAVFAHAAFDRIAISSEDPLPAPRWVYTKETKGIGGSKSVASQLASLKAAQILGEGSRCLDQARAVYSKAKSLQSWVNIVEIDCASKLSSSAANADKLARVLEQSAKNPQWLVSGPQAQMLRETSVRGYLTLIEQDAKTNRGRVWSSIDRLQVLDAWMDQKDKARMWRGAGDAAVAELRIEAARELFLRSLAEVDSEEVRAKLQSINTEDANSKSALFEGSGAKIKARPEGFEQQLEGWESRSQNAQPGTAQTGTAQPGTATPATTPAVRVQPFDASSEEVELVDRITTDLKAGDLVLAVTDAVKLILEFPGGTRAKWAVDRISEAYWSLADRQDPKLKDIRAQIVKQMGRVDAERVGEWARVCFNRGQYSDSFILARKALEKSEGTQRTRIIELAAEAAIAVEKYDVARELFRELIEKHSGTPASREGLLRLGLLHYRLGQYPQAIADLERALALPLQSESLEVIARHWLWRSLQKQNSSAERIRVAAEDLIRKFPFSYYGLRAQIEQVGFEAKGDIIGALEWNSPRAKIESKVWLTGHERIAWEKARLLLEAGWLDEAQAELRELPAPIRAEDKAIRALIWAAAGGFQVASRLANEAWDEKPELRRSPLLEAAFPSEFISFVRTQADMRKVDRDLVRGLIKQESGYNVKAVSSSNALGLMQMIPPTAREIANDLRMGSLLLPDDLFEPERNIEMGTYYLSRMISKYQGHVPLALAAYNAGPGRIDRWLRERPSLKGLATSRSSAPDDELWIDEIPYSETSFYVKAILRNLLLYRLFDQSRIEVANPLWGSVKK